MPVANILDFLKVLELQGSIFLDWRPDVFAVSRIFHRLKLVYAGDVPMERRRQAGLRILTSMCITIVLT